MAWISRKALDDLESRAGWVNRLEARLRQAEHNETVATERMMQAVSEHIVGYDSEAWTTETLVLFKMQVKSALEATGTLNQALGSLLNILEENVR